LKTVNEKRIVVSLKEHNFSGGTESQKMYHKEGGKMGGVVPRHRGSKWGGVLYTRHRKGERAKGSIVCY